MKQNDWIVAGLLNPDFSTNDFLIGGINVENTQLLPEDVYKKSDFVREKFTENGTFNEQKFNDFYKKKAGEFNVIQQMNTDENFIYGTFDPRATANNRRIPDYEIQMVANPTKEIDLLGQVRESGWSQREIAQQSKIKNSETGEWIEDSADDLALSKSPKKWFKSVFGDPLVYATYDENGEHYDPFIGQMVKHKKGQYILNEYGKPFTETLNGRSLIGKEVVSAFDMITSEEQSVNKYDFFDSDSLDKSITGTLAQTAVAIAPLFTPASGIYSGILIARELMKSLPMLYGMFSSVAGFSEDSKILNTIAGIGERFTTSTSDYGKSSMLNMETLSKMVSDIALQYSQQKLIFNSISKLRGTNNLLDDVYKKAYLDYNLQTFSLQRQLESGKITREAFERLVGDSKKWQDSVLGTAAIRTYKNPIEPILKKHRRLGADASLIYMALVSNTDVYSSMLEAGATKKEAAAVTLGSMAGMFTVNRYLHLGELFFDDLTAEYEHQIRRTLSSEINSWYKNVVKQNVKDPKKTSFEKFRNIFKAGAEYGKKQTNKFIEDLKYHTTGFIGKGIGEGLEEVGEELSADLSKSIYELAGTLGFDTSVQDVGAFKDWHKRYGMSFLGGTLGGGLFYGVDIYQNGKMQIDRTQDELIYIVRNGKSKELLKTLDDWHKKGKIGNKHLSYKTTTDENGNEVFLTAEKPGESQNDFIYNRIKETVLQLENIIDENDANLSDDQLYEKMILSESRFRDLEKYLKLQDFSYTTGYQRDYQRTLSKVIDLEGALQRANKTLTGLSYSSDEEFSRNIATDQQLRNLTDEEKNVREKNINRIVNDLNEAKKELNNFLSGKYSMEYTEKMLFALDPMLNDVFVTMTFDQWLSKNHAGKTVDDLSEEELSKFKQDYHKYQESGQTLDLDEKFALYKKIKDLINPVLLNIQKDQKNFVKFQESVPKILKLYSNFLAKEQAIQKDESIVDKDNQLSDNWKQLRQQINEIIDEHGGYIDTSTRRKLKLLIYDRNQDIVKAYLDHYKKQLKVNPLRSSEFDFELTSILDKLKSDFSNANEILYEIDDLLQNDIAIDLIESNQAIGTIRDIFIELIPDYNEDPYQYIDGIKGSDIKTFIDSQIQSGKSLDEIFPSYDSLNDGYKESINEDTYNYYIEQIKEKYTTGSLDTYFVERDNNYKNYIYSNDNLKQQYNLALSEINVLLNNMRSNPIIQLNNDLDQKLKEINPVVDLIKKLSLNLNINQQNLESILDRLSKRFDSEETVDSIILSPEEEESFEEAAYLFKLAQSYIYAASTRPNILNPFGHNRTLNDFAEKHKDIYKDFKKLPVLQEDVANMYIFELDNYIREIGVYNEKTNSYNYGSWRWLSTENQANKIQQFLQAEKAWNKTCFDIFNENRNSFKFTFGDDEYDLLKGFEDIPVLAEEELLITNNNIFRLFHNNINELISKGWTYTDIWERSQLFDKISKLFEISKQITSKLDKNINVDNISGYDKIIFLTTIAAMDSNKFYSFMYKVIEEEIGESGNKKIVPLTIQEWVTRVAIAQYENPEIFNQTNNYIKSKTGDNRPVIPNILFAGGNAGSGKSSVIARYVVKYANSDDIWLSAPADSQVNNLYTSVGKGVRMLNRDNLELSGETSKSLMSRLEIDIQAYTEALDKIKNKDKQSDKFTTELSTNEDADILNIDFDKFGIKKISNPPKYIIIDEVTHLSNLELQILGKWSQLNGVKILGLGDIKQSGFNGLGFNIDREQCFLTRSLELGISLRDNNIQHSFNLNYLESLINTLNNSESTDPNYKELVRSIFNKLGEIQFKVYSKDKINGELLTDESDTSYFDKLSGTIGFIGDKNSSVYQKLQESNIEVTQIDPSKVQGQEFDYIIIDKSFEIPMNSESAVNMLNFLQDLYTMISRGRNGSIIIDRLNRLRNVIGNNRVELVTGESPSIYQYAEEFSKNKLELYGKLLNNNQNNQESTPTPQPTPQPASQPTPTPQPQEENGIDFRTDSNDIIKPPPPSEPKDFGDMYDDGQIDDNLEDELLKSPILAYGNVTFTGFKVREENGKQIWINDSNDKVKRDGQIFTSNSEISDTEEQIKLSNLIRRLKNNILYRKSYNSLPKEISNLISREQYETIQWSIEVRPRNDYDHFIRNTGFSEDRMVLDKTNNLVFTIVGEFKLESGENAKITLGLMRDPKSWIDNNKRDIDRYNRKIQKALKNKDSKRKDYLKMLNSIDLQDPNSEINQYVNFCSKLVGRYEHEGTVKIPIQQMMFPGLTNLHRTKKIVRLHRIKNGIIKSIQEDINKLNQKLQEAEAKKLRDGTIGILKSKIKRLEEKLKEIQEKKESSFESKNPYTVISPMYIYTPSDTIRNNGVIDDSVVGRCNVVFVSNDNTIDPDELVEIYMMQKNMSRQEGVDLKESKSVPTVRMIPLSNLGVSFQDLSNPYMKDMMYSETSFMRQGQEVTQTNIYPFKTHYMGARMYVGLWNFRANLLTFKKQVNKFIESLPGFNEEKLDLYLKVKDLLWRKENSKKALTKEENDFLEQNKNLTDFESISAKIDEFNLKLDEKVKQFRLGSDLTNGAYVRRLTGNLKTFYGTNDNINGIYINTTTLDKYIDIAETLFTSVLDHIVETNYDKERLISSKQSGPINSLSNCITKMFNQNGELQITDEYDNQILDIKFSSAKENFVGGIGNTFSHIPAVLSKVFKFTEMRQRRMDGNFKSTIKLQGKIEKDGKEETFEDTIPYKDLQNVITVPDEFTDDSTYEFDKSLSNFFSFAFHGTLESINDKNAQKASDAFAPNGFYADPISTTEVERNGAHKMFTKAIQNPEFFGVDVEVGDPTFFISLSEAKRNFETLDTKDDTTISLERIETKKTDFIRMYPSLENKINELLNQTEIESENDFDEIVQELLEIEASDNFNKYSPNSDSFKDGSEIILYNEQFISMKEAVIQFVQEQGETCPFNANEIKIQKQKTKWVFISGETIIGININQKKNIPLKEKLTFSVEGKPQIQPEFDFEKIENILINEEFEEIISNLHQYVDESIYKGLKGSYDIAKKALFKLKNKKAYEAFIKKLQEISTRLKQNNSIDQSKIVDNVINQINNINCIM